MSFYTALTGLNGSQADISATSNNIANVATTGYKRSKAEFGDIFAMLACSSQPKIFINGLINGYNNRFIWQNTAKNFKCCVNVE